MLPIEAALSPAKAFARFCHKFTTDEAFPERIQTNARRLKPTLLDEDPADPSGWREL
jgi:hypothetical protein